MKGIASRDILLLLLTSFLVMLVLVIPFLAEDKKADDSRKGTIIVDLYWDDDNKSDVDLWVRGPDNIPVGYSNKGGPLFNLIRDDLGSVTDVSGLNQETTLSTGFVPGKYTVNVHLYRLVDSPPSGKVIVSVKPAPGANAKQYLFTEFTLKAANQQITLFNFELAADKSLVPGSVNNIPVKLR